MIHHYFKYCITLLAAPLLFAGCGNKRSHSGSAVSEIEASDSIPQSVKSLVQAVADGDSARFASLVSYPLARPYPLRDIKDSVEMVKYYPRLVDDSLRNALTHSGPRHWGEYGWRGWTLDDGALLWVDDNLYEVEYLSAAERSERDSLAQREIASLSPELRGAWIPETCLRDTVTGTVYRLDAHHPDHKGKRHPKKGDHRKGDTIALPDADNLEETVIYRLAGYPGAANLSGHPAVVATGRKHTEGTAGTVLYIFETPDATRIELEPSPADSDSPRLRLSTLPDSVITLTPAYWRDLIN